TVGTAWCFTLDAVSYLAVIIALVLMRLPSTARTVQRGDLGRNLVEGFRYTFGFPPIRTLLLLVGLISFLAMPYSVLLPLFAVNVLHGDSYTLGFLTAASGVGALIGAVYLASRRSVLGLGRLIVIAAVVLGLGMVGFAESRLLWLSLLLLLATGFGMM